LNESPGDVTGAEITVPKTGSIRFFGTWHRTFGREGGIIMEEEIKKTERSLLVPFLVGGLVGAGVALLLAPKSGKEVRKDIKDLAMTTRDKVVDTVEMGQELYDKGITAVKGAIEEGKRAWTERREKHLKAA
jgi:gas vesicle protein